MLWSGGRDWGMLDFGGVRSDGRGLRDRRVMRGMGGGDPPCQGGRPVNGPGDRVIRVGDILKVCCMNVRGCNKEEKREEIGVMFKDEGIDILAVCETKLKGKGWVQFGVSRELMSGVNERVRAKRGWV